MTPAWWNDEDEDPDELRREYEEEEEEDEYTEEENIQTIADMVVAEGTEMGSIEQMRPLKGEFHHSTTCGHSNCTQFPILYLMDGDRMFTKTRVALN